MSDSVDHYLTRRSPTAARPLLGLTILLVEDSRYASEAVRIMGLRSGARLRRADNLRSARRHLAAYRPAVAIVDLGLPDGSGAELIAEITRSGTVGTVIATSGDPDAAAEARAAGAHDFLAKPIATLGQFQEAILRLLPEEARPRGPRPLSQETFLPDPIAFRDDMAHIADLMAGADAEQMADYVAQFLGGVARSAEDHGLADAAVALAAARADGRPAEGDFSRLRALVNDRLNTRAAI